MDIASISGVAAAVVTVLAFLTGLWQFNRTQRMTQQNLKLQEELLRHERESKAVDLFVKFNDLKASTAGKPLDQADESLFWPHNSMVAITESVFKLTNGDPEWDRTVVWMLERQTNFLSLNAIDNGTYSAKFLSLIKKTIPTTRYLRPDPGAA